MSPADPPDGRARDTRLTSGKLALNRVRGLDADERNFVFAWLVYTYPAAWRKRC